MRRDRQSAGSWAWVFFVAIILSGFVWHQNVDATKKSVNGSQLSARTYTIASDLNSYPTAYDRRGLTQSIYDIDLSPPQSTWIEYRNRQTSDHLASAIEPQASVALMAPMPELSEEEWLSKLRRQSEMRNNFSSAGSSQFSMATTTLSETVKASTPTDLTRSDWMTQPMTSLWPLPQQLINSLAQLEALGLELQANSPDGSNANPSELSAQTSSASNAAGIELVRLSREAKEHINRLCNLSECCDEVRSILAQLENISSAFSQFAMSNAHDIRIAEPTSRIAHSIMRRAKLWQGVTACLTTDAEFSLTGADFSRSELSVRIASLLKHAESTGDIEGWRKYLLVSDLERIASGTNLEEFDIYATRQLLDRVSWMGVSEPQRKFLNSKPVRQLAEYVQPIAIKPIDYRSLLSAFETLENDALHRCSSNVVSSLQSLRYSNNPHQVALSEIIGTYYRNANVRIAVSADLLNRFVPKSGKEVRSVQQNILGAKTTGGSTIDSSLSVALKPNKSAWHVQLKLNADIASKTASEKWPAVVHTASQMNVLSSRDILVSTESMKVQPGSLNAVASRDKVRDVDTDFDSLPIVSEIVRFIVDQQIRQQRPAARRITQRIVNSETNRQFDSQLNSQLDAVKQKVQDRVVKPFQFIGIDTDVVDLQTTDSRLIARYRIASLDTLAANTPRPQAPVDSMLSMQVHQSAINNTINQLKLGSKEWRIPDLMSYLAERMNFGIIDRKDDIPENVIIQFEELNPICIEFKDNEILVSLRIARLREPGRIDLNHFVIRVTYGLEANGLAATLVRTGAISVDGERLGMRDRLPLRAIFGKIFAAHTRVPLMKGNIADDSRLEGLAVSQVISREGWISLAVSPVESPNVASVQPSLSKR